VLTENTARKYFGEESPVGKMMNWDNKSDYAITGVVRDPPPNSHFRFSVLASFSTFFTYDPRLEEYWWGWNVPTYLLLQEGTDYKSFEEKFTHFNEKYLGEVLETRGIFMTNRLEPLKKIHLYSSVSGGLEGTGNIKVVYAFLSIATVILLIACINFINLTTSRFTDRAKEVGLKKIMGAGRRLLSAQFFSETALYGFLALVIALILAQLLLPLFNNLSERDIALNYIEFPWLAFALVTLLVFVTTISGFYPSLFLSRFNPINVLKGRIIPGGKNIFLRSALVVFQFTVSIFLIIFTFVIRDQQRFMRNKDLGFNKDNVLVIALQNEPVRLSLESFKEELHKLNGIVGTGASSMVPGEMYLFTTTVYPEGFTTEQTLTMQNFLVDYGYFDAMKIEMIRGRGFSPDITTDHVNGIVINESAAKAFQWEDPIGRKVNVVSSLENNKTKTTQWEIIGVCKDFHNRSLYSSISPLFINYISNEGPIENRARRLVVRLDGNDMINTMERIEGKWEAFFPGIPFYSFFLDEFYESQHRAEEKLGKVFMGFTLLAIFIACLGLFGLAAYTTEQRTKEIGIRKVLGSTARAVIFLFCKQYLRLIGISNLIALPVVIPVARRWLQNYPYGPELTLSPFIITALVTFLLGFLTIIYHSGKAALINPAETLKYD
jgi:putative ABC transport system permease protein